MFIGDQWLLRKNLVEFHIKVIRKFPSVLFLNMARFVVVVVLLGLFCSAESRTCNPDEGVPPGPCDPSTCLLPDCACAETEPDVPLADRPQVINN